MKGGYKIIDLKNTNFTLSTGMTIEGVHEKVENNYYKALLVENFQIGGVEQVAQFVTFTTSGSDLVGNLKNVLGNFNEVALDSTDPESDVLEIEDSDKDLVLAYLLNQDTDGKSQLVKDLENPTTLIELAWLRTQGRTLIDNTTRYWKDLLKQERKEKAKLQKELESYQTRNEQSVVVPKPPKKNENSNSIPTFGSVWDNI